jgi:hypothetical protein
MVLCRSITLKFGNSSKLVFTKNSSALLRLATAAGLGMAALVSRSQTFNVIHDNQLGGFALGRSVCEVADGFLLFGEQGQVDPNARDLIITRFNDQGQFVSEKRLTKLGEQYYWKADPISAVPWASGFIGFANMRPDQAPPDTVQVFRLDANGDTLWSKPLVTGYSAVGKKVTAKYNRIFSAGGYNVGAIGDTLVGYAMRADTSATVQLFQRTARINASGIDADAALNMYLAGSGEWPPPIAGKLCLMKMDSSWQRNLAP